MTKIDTTQNYDFCIVCGSVNADTELPIHTFAMEYFPDPEEAEKHLHTALCLEHTEMIQMANVMDKSDNGTVMIVRARAAAGLDTSRYVSENDEKLYLSNIPPYYIERKNKMLLVDRGTLRKIPDLDPEVITASLVFMKFTQYDKIEKAIEELEGTQMIDLKMVENSDGSYTPELIQNEPDEDDTCDCPACNLRRHIQFGNDSDPLFDKKAKELFENFLRFMPDDVKNNDDNKTIH